VLRVLGFRFRAPVSGFGFRIAFFVFRLSDFEIRVSGFGFRISCFQFGVSSFEFRASGFGFRVSYFEFRISGFGFQVSGSTLGLFGCGRSRLSPDRFGGRGACVRV